MMEIKINSAKVKPFRSFNQQILFLDVNPFVIMMKVTSDDAAKKV